jgi:hypothetical protein
MKSEIQKYLLECSICQSNKYETKCTLALLLPVPIPHNNRESISMNLITGLSNFCFFAKYAVY